MAKRRTGRATGKEPAIRLMTGRKADVLGIVLVAVGLLTLLSLLSHNRGLLTEQWILALRLGLGIGLYLFPLGLVALGFWLVLLDAKQRETFGWERPAGLGLLFLLLVTAAHLIAAIGKEPWEAAALGAGGGYLGAAFSSLLIGAVGVIGAWVVLVALLFVSLILLLDITLVEFGRLVARRLGEIFVRDKPTSGTLEPTTALEEISPSLSKEGSVASIADSEADAEPSVSIEDVLQRVRVRRPGGMTNQGTVSAVPERFPSTSSPVAATAFSRPDEGGPDWALPPLAEIFDESTEAELSQAEVRERVRIIEETLASFGVPARVVEVNQGPAVTQFGVAPGYVEKKDGQDRVKRSKVKVSRISGLSKDLALALAASPIRIEAPVPGRPIVGIEVPNTQTSLVMLRSVMEAETFQIIASSLRIALGQDVSGNPISADLATMPHLLIAGATGSGKSVCINSVVACLLSGNTPKTLRLLMIDPKRVELIQYNGVPHLITPVVVDLERVVGALQWATREMDRRYQVFAKAGVRNLEGYNQGQASRGEPQLPQLVIVIDELADLMMVAPDEVERAICRIAQMARATGIHLIIATQRPSVDVVTGLIKANFPARIAFAVTSQVDSRVILDVAGAEQLLGRGDMLFMAPDSAKLKRLQGCYVSDRELHRLVRFWKGLPGAGEEPYPQVVQPPLWEELKSSGQGTDRRDALFDEAIRVIRHQERASISMLQRRLRIGYSRAARLIDQLEEEGYVGPEEGGNRSRNVLISGESDAYEADVADESQRRDNHDRIKRGNHRVAHG